jgi:hypothetical protein
MLALLRRLTVIIHTGEGGNDAEGLVPRTMAYLQDLCHIQGFVCVPVLAIIGFLKVDALHLDRNAVKTLKLTSTKAVSESEDPNRTSVISETSSLPTKQQKIISIPEASRTSGSGLMPLVLLLTLVFYTIVFHSLSNLPLANRLLYGVHQRFWLQPSLLVFISSGVGVNVIAHCLQVFLRIFKFHNMPALSTSIEWVIRLGCFGCVLAGVLHQYYSWHDISDQSEAMHFSNYAAGMLDPLPLNAVLLVNYDQMWTSLRYLHICEKFRPDVTLINLSLMTFRWFRHQKHLYPNINFPGDMYYSQSGVATDNTTTFTLSAFLESNLKGRPDIYLIGKPSFSDPLFLSKFDSVPAGLTQQLVPMSESPIASKHRRRNGKEWAKVSKHVTTLPSLERYPEETWEWTLGRDYTDKVTDAASFRLMKAIETAATDPDSLIEAVYFIEYAAYLEMSRNNSVPTFVLKNLGLGHVHLIQNKAIPDDRLPPPKVDFFRILPALSWPAKDWKTWSSDRFVSSWGQFLKRKDAKSDSQYKVIKSMYAQATGKAKT